MDAVRAHAARGGLVLGICNGFQIMTDGGLLPGVLMRNAELRFVCHRVHLRVERTDTPFTNLYGQGQAIDVCIAHGEGNYFCDRCDAAAPRRGGSRRVPLLRRAGQRKHSATPNGSFSAIAGIYSPNRRVLGMMPHPENLIDPLVGGTDGLPLFQSLVASLAAA